MEEKKGFWSKMGNSIEKIAKKSGEAITKVVKKSVEQTERAFNHVGDSLMNNGLCYQCKNKAEIPVPCEHILCTRCAKHYLEAMWDGNSQVESIPCFICQKPLSIELLQKYWVIPQNNPHEEEKEVPQITQQVREINLHKAVDDEESKTPAAEQAILSRPPVVNASESLSDPNVVEPKPEIVLKQCPHCAESIEILNNSRTAQCSDSKCNQSFCPQCNHEEHPFTKCGKVIEKPGSIVPNDSKCPICEQRYLKVEGCNFLRCVNGCEGDSCFCLLCEHYLKKSDYFSHFLKTGPYGDACNMAGEI